MHSGVYFEVLATGARVGWRPRWDPNFNHSFNTSKCSNQKSIERKNHQPIRFKKSYRTTYCLKLFKAICFLTLRRSALTALTFWPLKLDCETHRRDEDIIFFLLLFIKLHTPFVRMRGKQMPKNEFLKNFGSIKGRTIERVFLSFFVIKLWSSSSRRSLKVICRTRS